MLLTGFDAQVPQHPVCRQEPQAPWSDTGVFAHKPCAQRDQTLWTHSRFPPATCITSMLPSPCFSGEHTDRAKEIWLVDKAPVVIDDFKQAVADLDELYAIAGPRQPRPDQVNNLMGDASALSVYQPVQGSATASRRNLTNILIFLTNNGSRLNRSCSKDNLREFRSGYLKTAKRLKDQQGKPGKGEELSDPEVEQVEFEFVLFASADHRLRLHHGADRQVLQARIQKRLRSASEQLDRTDIGLTQSSSMFERRLPSTCPLP